MAKIEFSNEELVLLSNYTNSSSITDILRKFGGDIDKLKAYVKWIYKYGGTGSGNGNGNGSGTTSWSLNGIFDGQVIGGKDSIVFNINNSNTYILTLSISRPGISSYFVEVLYNNVKLGTKTLSAEDNEYTLNINVKDNGTLLVNVKNNDDDDKKTYTSKCILFPHNLSYSLVDNYDTELGNSNSTLYIKNINNGLRFKINHDLYISGAKNVKIKSFLVGGRNYPINDIALNNNGINETTGNSFSYIDLNEIIGLANYENIDDIVGTYNLSGYFSYDYNGNKTEEFNFTFTLIPEGLYLKVLPKTKNAFIYSEQQQDPNDELVYKFNTKNIILNITAYDDVATSLTLWVQKDNEYIINGTTIYRQQAQQFTIQLNSDIESITEHELTFMVSNGIKTNSYTYYIYINKDSSDLLWFDHSLVIDKESYFRGNSIYNHNDNNNINSDILKSINRNFSSQGYIQMNAVDDPEGKLVYHENDNNFSTEFSDLLISFGIQYNEVNVNNADLLKLTFDLGQIGSPEVIIRQNFIIINQNTKINIFIPKETNFDISDITKYHIMNILIRNTKNSNNGEYAYEFVVYIDGYIEAASSTYFTTGSLVKLKDIVAYGANYGINLLDIAYINNEDFQISDINVVQYYYKFNNYFNNPNISQEDIDYFDQIKDIAAYFEYVDYHNNSGDITTSVIRVNNNQINNEEKLKELLMTKNNSTISHKVPFLIVNMDLKNSIQYPTHQVFFETFLNKNVEQNEFANLNSISVSSFTIINDNGIAHKYNHTPSTFKLQGSSTGKFKSKNFTLGINSSIEGKVALFTPNFKHDDNNSFLPEAMFTFKADAVDSTHANNTSAGLFINKNTTPFNDSRSVHSNADRYKKYIKNCLTGFPILTFFGLVDLDENNNERVTYYYMGIYNCNLGRDSYLNLGYFNVGDIMNNLEDIDENPIDINKLLNEGTYDGFNVYLVSQDKYQPINDLCVAEIQGGNSYFDFSQFGEHILFEDVNGKEGMFEDFYPKTDDLSKQKQKIRTFVRMVSIIGGNIFSNLGKYMSNNPENNYGYDDGYNGCYKDGNIWHYTESINSVPNYRHQYDRVGSNFEEDIEATNKLSNDLNSITDWTDVFRDFIGIKTNIDGQYDPNEYTNNAPLFSSWFYLLDYNSLVEYYTICMAFGLVDSVMKNLNIKSFRERGPFYIAFYDMDTAFGRDNGGMYVDPFAFSDYWQNSIDKFGNNVNTIYRDFYPDKDIPNQQDSLGIHVYEDVNVPTGYDIPSSYLFAIAKYAKTLYLDKENLDRYKTNPNYYWYTLRYSDSAATCELKNAKYFIDNYFGINLNKINRIFFNANYRYKYLQKTNSGFDTTNLGPFHGRGLYSLEDWLNKRFHVLDAYFNIKEMQSGNNFQTYNRQTNTWEDILIGNNSKLYDPKFSDIIGENTPALSNPDIYLTRSLFSESNTSSAGTYGGGSIGTISINTLDYSPMSFSYQQTGDQFICIDSSKLYRYKEPQGLKGQITWYFGGSIAWTHVDSFNTLIPSTKILSLNAPYLEDIIITNSELIGLNLINIPSVRQITITSNRVSCNVELINDARKDLYPNLRKINLSGSKCNLIADNLNVTDINVSNINAPGSDMKITNCPNLKACDFNNTTLQSLEITSLWSDNITIQNTNIQRITIINTQFNNASISISNDNSLTKLSISGFSRISITNCPNLSEVTIQEDISIGNLTLLNYVNNSNNVRTNNLATTKFIISSTSNNQSIEQPITDINLTPLMNLEEISFKSTRHIHTITLPNINEITLLPYAFANTNLSDILYENRSIKHYLVLTDNADNIGNRTCGAFYNCNFTYNSNNIIFKVNKPTSLKSAFEIIKSGNSIDEFYAYSGLSYQDAANIINNLDGKENVISLDRIFYRQSYMAAEYNSIENKYIWKIGDEKYNLSDDKHISLEGYTNLQSCEEMFWGTNVKFLDNILFGINTASNISSISIINMFDQSLNYVHIDALSNIKNKVNQFMYSEDNTTDENNIPYRNYNTKFTLYDNSGIINNPRIHDFLYNDESNLNYITKLIGININNVNYDLSGLFTNNQANVNTIINCFNKINQNLVNGLNEIGLRNISDNLSLYNSFVSINTNKDDIPNDHLIDILSYINYDRQYRNIINNLSNFVRNSTYYNIFDFYKKITFVKEDLSDDNWDISKDNNWKSFWNNIITTIPNNTNIQFLLSNTKFITPINEFVLLLPDNINGWNKINNIYGLFQNSTAIYNNEEIGIKLNDDSLKYFTNVKNTSYMFAGCKFDGRSQYPISENVLSQLSNLEICERMFANTKIIGNHKTYDLNPEYLKQVYYKYHLGNDNNGKQIHNYKFDDVRYNIGSAEIINEGYPIIPINIFNSNTLITNISGIFAESDFEGYIPSGMFTNNNILTNIESMFALCKVLPQYIKTIPSNERIDIYNQSESLDTNIFAFIGENFGNSTINRINGLFGFYVLVSRTNEQDSENRIYLFLNNSLDINQITGIDNFNINVNKNSTIVSTYINENGQYSLVQGNKLNEGSRIFNIYFDVDNNKEGITIDWLNKLSMGNSLLNPEMIDMYYGYIMKRGTIIDSTYFNIIKNHNIASIGKKVVDESNPGNYTSLLLSDNTILPSIIKYSIIEDYILPNNFVGNSWNSINNIYFYSKLYKIDISNFSIKIDNIDIDTTYTYNYNEIKDEYTFNFIGWDYTYKNDENKSIEEIESIAIQEYKNIIYYNYLIMFNEWDLNTLSATSEYTAHTSLTTYNRFRLISNNDYYINVKTVMNNTLYNKYDVYCEKSYDGTTYNITSIVED